VPATQLPDNNGKFVFMLPTPVLASYVRFVAGHPVEDNGADLGPVFRVTQLEVYGWNIPSVNVATNCVHCRCFSHETQMPESTLDYQCPALFDDQTDTDGQVPAGGYAIRMFPSPVVVNSISVVQSASRKKGDFWIDTFNDGEWTQRVRVEDLPAEDVPERIWIYPPVSTLQVRFRGGSPFEPGPHSEMFYSLEEIRIFGARIPPELLVGQGVSGVDLCPQCECLSPQDDWWSSSGCHSLIDGHFGFADGSGYHLKFGDTWTLTFPEPVLLGALSMQQHPHSWHWRGDFKYEAFGPGAEGEPWSHWTELVHVPDATRTDQLPLAEDGSYLYQLPVPMPVTKIRFVAGAAPTQNEGHPDGRYRLVEMSAYGWPMPGQFHGTVSFQMR